MADSQTYPTWAQPAADDQANVLDPVASAAAEARRRAAEGYTTADFRKELKRSKRRRGWKRFFIALVIVIALIAAAIAAVFALFSVNQVNYDTMEPVLQSGQTVVSNKDANVATGDVIAYRDGATIVFGRVVAKPGNWVTVMDDGTLIISDEQLDDQSAKAYVQSASSKVRTSRQVPSESYFVLGDSENATLNSVANGDNYVDSSKIIGKALYKVWPIANFGPVL